MYNTPPVFSIWVLTLVTRWLREEVGGLEKQRDVNHAKATALYDVLDELPDVYRGHASAGSRSVMNVTFRSPSEDLDRRFVQEAATRGMIGLKGHRSVGGVRASIYDAMPIEGALALARFMREFAVRTTSSLVPD